MVDPDAVTVAVGLVLGIRVRSSSSDLAGPGTGGDVGAPVSAHLPDEPRPDLTQDGSPVERIIPELRKHVRAGLAAPPTAAAQLADASSSRHHVRPKRLSSDSTISCPASMCRLQSAADAHGRGTACEVPASGTADADHVADDAA